MVEAGVNAAGEFIAVAVHQRVAGAAGQSGQPVKAVEDQRLGGLEALTQRRMHGARVRPPESHRQPHTSGGSSPGSRLT